MTRTVTAHHQRGQTLISMMVGLVISLLTIAAMLVLYKNMIESTGNASRSALRDGQVASALLAAQSELQEAGFGIPVEDSLGSRLTISSDGKQVAWRFKHELGQADRCAGLRLVDTAEGSSPARGLYRLPPKLCGSAAAATWADTEWQPVAAEAAFFDPVQKDGSAFSGTEREVGPLTLRGATGGEGYRFTAVPDACLPYQQQETVERTGQRVILRQASDDVLFSVCLPNLTVSPAA